MLENCHPTDLTLFTPNGAQGANNEKSPPLLLVLSWALGDKLKLFSALM